MAPRPLRTGSAWFRTGSSFLSASVLQGRLAGPLSDEGQSGGGSWGKGQRGGLPQWRGVTVTPSWQDTPGDVKGTRRKRDCHLPHRLTESHGRSWLAVTRHCHGGGGGGSGWRQPWRPRNIPAWVGGPVCSLEPLKRSRRASSVPGPASIGRPCADDARRV